MRIFWGIAKNGNADRNQISGGRYARQAKRSEQPSAPAYITRKISYYDFLDEDALAAIEAQAYIAQRKEAMPDE